MKLQTSGVLGTSYAIAKLAPKRAEKDVVEVMEALGFSGSRDNSRNKDVCIGCVRKAKYKRDGAALAGMVNLTWFGYYRPKL